MFNNYQDQVHRGRTESAKLIWSIQTKYAGRPHLLWHWNFMEIFPPPPQSRVICLEISFSLHDWTWQLMQLCTFIITCLCMWLSFLLINLFFFSWLIYLFTHFIYCRQNEFLNYIFSCNFFFPYFRILDNCILMLITVWMNYKNIIS